MVAKSIASRKAKARTMVDNVCGEIRLIFGNMTQEDVQRTPNSVTGIDILLSERARKYFPYAIECKAQENLNIWSALEQAEDNAAKENKSNSKVTLKPLLVFKRSRTKTYACVELTHFIQLVNDIAKVERYFDDKLRNMREVISEAEHLVGDDEPKKVYNDSDNTMYIDEEVMRKVKEKRLNDFILECERIVKEQEKEKHIIDDNKV